MAQANPIGELEDTPTYRMLVLITVALCAMLYSLTITIVNVALPQLQGALSATQDQISWVVTLNVVATAVATPLTGSFVAFFGQRKLLLWAILGFTISSLACAMINSLESLLFFRILQGIFGAPMVPLAQAILLATYPPEEHAKANGFLGLSVVIGPAIAPSIGGYLADEYNWRWIFLMIVPLGVMAGMGVLRYIREAGRNKSVRFDYVGFALFSITIIALQLVLDRGERLDWFDSPFIIGSVALTATAFYMFIVHTYFTEQPFINPRLFLNRNYVIGLFLVFVYGSLNFTPLVLLPSLLQNLKGYPDTLIGMILAMRGVGMVAGFFFAARMGRLDPRVGLVAGMVMVGISGWAMSLYDLNVSFWTLSWPSILQGVGCGLMWVPLSVVTFSTLEKRLLPEGASLFHLLRNLGTSLYVAFTVFLLIRTSKISYSEMVEGLTPYAERLQFQSVIGGWAGSLGRLSGEVTRQSTMIGYNNSFYFYALVCFATLPVLAFVTTRKESK
ncbi:MAG: DHA2 family efflux MFS transporter permease subunit [Rhodospirillaceae bacterium]|nr:DHA2 family efflux MFS transporter permease subunit [Rhodospirillaceae bacterium]MBT6139242.1 DHA2 family efflux MFS transporter permease subunit [Rhodospirillaceae bacterium]